MPTRVVITAEKVQGHCPIYKTGDKITIEEFYIKSQDSQNIRIHAFAATSTLLSAFLHGCSATKLGIGPEENTGYIRCPDPGPPCTKGGNVLFKLEKQKTYFTTQKHNIRDSSFLVSAILADAILTKNYYTFILSSSLQGHTRSPRILVVAEEHKQNQA